MQRYFGKYTVNEIHYHVAVDRSLYKCWSDEQFDKPKATLHKVRAKVAQTPSPVVGDSPLPPGCTQTEQTVQLHLHSNASRHAKVSRRDDRRAEREAHTTVRLAERERSGVPRELCSRDQERVCRRKAGEATAEAIPHHVHQLPAAGVGGCLHQDSLS